ncbi:hypothetical protein NN4_56420 [Nocardia ninae NBRC 108245]|uniref:Uncharacterized protein n=1 Tax=Nocardia ninae NBRC 108245 TaxID=1210091 RepID=A0A511MKG7_9NOCA|nr:hypothetical protein NN4_56420 [Nocardia ninae NBRC 108245]
MQIEDLVGVVVDLLTEGVRQSGRRVCGEDDAIEDFDPHCHCHRNSLGAAEAL